MTQKILRIFLVITGAVWLTMILLAFTTLPFWNWYHHGAKSSGIHRPPGYIVVMGGSGMPGESGLIRCWYTAAIANHFTRARVIIALPGDIMDPASSVNGMKNELILRGVEPERILFEDSGTNTRSQAVNIANGKVVKWQGGKTVRRRGDTADSLPSILIVTSPAHLHRAVLSFRKAGFTHVDGQAAWERNVESDLVFKGRKIGGKRYIPDIGDNLTVRYEFWTQLNYELTMMREWMALAYYWAQGWI